MHFLVEKTYAASASSLGPEFDKYFGRIITEILEPVVLLLFSLAVIYFLYGVFMFVKDAGSADKRQEGGQHILWGVIGMFIMISVYGIINLVLGTLFK